MEDSGDCVWDVTCDAADTLQMISAESVQYKRHRITGHLDLLRIVVHLYRCRPFLGSWIADAYFCIFDDAVLGGVDRWSSALRRAGRRPRVCAIIDRPSARIDAYLARIYYL